MAETETPSTTGIVAIFAILVLIVIAAFLVWRTGLFGGDGSGGQKPFDIEAPVNVK